MPKKSALFLIKEIEKIISAVIQIISKIIQIISAIIFRGLLTAKTVVSAKVKSFSEMQQLLIKKDKIFKTFFRFLAIIVPFLTIGAIISETSAGETRALLFSFF